MMFFDSDELTSSNDDFLICLGIEDFLCGHDFGRDRGVISPHPSFPLVSSFVGRHPEPSESQRKAVEKLAGKLYLRPPKNSKSDEEAEDIVEIDLLDSPRVILYDGKILKKSKDKIISLLSS
jgi:hypothetical protein